MSGFMDKVKHKVQDYSNNSGNSQGSGGSNNSSSGGGGYNNNSSSGGGGYGDDSSSGYGNNSSSGGGGYGKDSSSGGGGGYGNDSSSGGGGYGDDSSSGRGGSGGYGNTTSSGGGGYGDDSASGRGGSGGYGNTTSSGRGGGSGGYGDDSSSGGGGYGNTTSSGRGGGGGYGDDSATDTDTYRMNHTMIRIKDPEKSLKFYQEVMGMELKRTAEMKEAGFNLYFLGYGPPAGEKSANGVNPTAHREGLLELTWNYGTEKDADFKYHNGNDEPQGFGHICATVDNLDAACARFEKLNVNWKKRLTDGRMKTVAFILDPDNYWIEIVQNESLKE